MSNCEGASNSHIEVSGVDAIDQVVVVKHKTTKSLMRTPRPNHRPITLPYPKPLDAPMQAQFLFEFACCIPYDSPLS